VNKTQSKYTNTKYRI